MIKKWTVADGDLNHTVIYERRFGGKAKITIDSDEFDLGRVGRRERVEPFRIGDGHCNLILKGKKAEIQSIECEVKAE